MSLTYTLKESLAGFRRNRAGMVITVFTVSIALLLLGVFSIITVNFTLIVDDIRGRVDVEVFLKKNLTLEDHVRTGRQLRGIPGVADAAYISTDEAVQRFEEEIGDTFEDILDTNPFPASYKLSIAEGYDNPDSVAVIAQRAKRLSAVDDVEYRKQFLDLLERRVETFEFATLFIGIALALSSIILVANTIRLTIYAKRELIRTMKLVGATPMFIRLPFLIEGMLHGAIGGVMASGLIFFAMNYFINPIANDLLVRIQIDWMYYLFLTVLGCSLGLLGSILSIGHFLRETVVTE